MEHPYQWEVTKVEGNKSFNWFLTKDVLYKKADQQSRFY